MLETKELPEKWKLLRITEVANKSITINPLKQPEKYFNYVDISSIDNSLMKLNGVKKIRGKDAPSRARKHVKKGSIIFATTRPNLKNIALIDVDLDNPVCSTGFCVIEPIKEKIDERYVYYYLTTNYIQKQIEPFIRGAQYPAISDKDLLNCLVPIPPLQEQKRIVAKIETLFERIDRAIKLLEEDIKSCDDLMKSALNEVFEGAEKKGWEKHKFKEIAKFIDYRGRTPEKTETGIKLITAKNVKWGFVADEPAEYIDSKKYKEYMTRGIPNNGDILFTTEAPLGNVAQIESNERIALAQRLITFQSLHLKYTPRFLMYYLMSDFFRNELFEKSTGSTVKGIKSKILKEIIIYLPQISFQETIISFLDSISIMQKELKSKITQRLEHLKALKDSILDSAFRGEL